MKSLLVCISNFGPHGINYLRRTVSALRDLPWNTEIIIDSNVSIDIPGCSVRLFPSDGFNLSFRYRTLMKDCLNDYDLFFYGENDILVTGGAMLAVFSAQERLPLHYVSGFIRFEERQDKKFLLDLHPPYLVHNINLFKVCESEWFCLPNLHSGCFLLDKRRLDYVIANNGFPTVPHAYPYGLLEQAASDPYTRGGLFHKIFPATNWRHHLVHHQPNKYVIREDHRNQFSIQSLATLERAISLAGRYHQSKRPPRREFNRMVETCIRIWRKFDRTYRKFRLFSQRK